ncbi:hypothetical protein BDN70DRAFT_713990 [Pholiota conissans]|uniref:Uncharacterized protein n=1 Tax=Pholiota conissans TaxID=109636 RepID=A0A9P6CQM5_9AGAR|nr:hypothetical protein BDN70DRAFT_713990 [Pholiota conissans]
MRYYSSLSFILCFLRAVLDCLTSRVEHAITTTTSDPTTSAVSSSGEAVIDLGPNPKQDDYPRVRFWFSNAYKEFSDKKKTGNAVLDPTALRVASRKRFTENGENVATDYIETEDGQIVDGRVAKSIRDHLRAIYNEMEKSKKKVLPAVWGDVGLSDRKYVFRELYKEFPYIRLCDDNWKAKRLASTVLTSFHSRTKRRGQNAVKQETGVKTVASTSSERASSEKIESSGPDDTQGGTSQDLSSNTSTISASTTTVKKRKAPLSLNALSKRQCPEPVAPTSSLPSQSSTSRTFTVSLDPRLKGNQIAASDESRLGTPSRETSPEAGVGCSTVSAPLNARSIRPSQIFSVTEPL